MGSSLTPIGIGDRLSPDSRAARARGDDRAPVPQRKSGQRGLGDFFAPGGAGFSRDDGNNGLQGGALYEVAAGLVFQQQLLFSGAPGITTNAPASPQDSAAPSSPAPSSPASGNESGGSGGAEDSVALGFAITAEAALGIQTVGSSGAQQKSGQTGASQGSTSTGIPSPATVKQEEVQLQQALQELGLSPAAIQQFTYDGQLLAQVAPGMFQEFLSYVLELAKAAEPSVPAAGAAAATSAAIAQTATAPPPQSVVLEFGSAQATEAEISITPNQNGGETISLSAASASVSFADLQTTASSQPTANPPQPPTSSTSAAPSQT